MNKFLRKIFILITSFILLSGILIISILWNYSNDLPDYKFLKNYKPPVSSKVYSGNGDLVADATVSIDTKQMVLQEGNIITGESLVLNAENLKMRFQTNTIGTQLILNVSNILSDGGVGANNIIKVERGVVLQKKPNIGDLLGTEITATAEDFVNQEMIWNAEDYGVSIKGFENNAALGRLILKNGNLSKFEFMGSEEGGNAIYIDYIEFDQLTKDDIKDGRVPVLDIKPGFTLYFAASNTKLLVVDSEILTPSNPASSSTFISLFGPA